MKLNKKRNEQTVLRVYLLEASIEYSFESVPDDIEWLVAV